MFTKYTSPLILAYDNIIIILPRYRYVQGRIRLIFLCFFVLLQQGVLSNLPMHPPQLATQSQQQYFPMASAANTNGVPQAGPRIINQANFNGIHKPVQNWGHTIKQVPPKTTQVADQPKLIQVQPLITL